MKRSKDYSVRTRTCRKCGKKQANVWTYWSDKWIDFEYFLKNYNCITGNPTFLDHM